jgi:integrase
MVWTPKLTGEFLEAAQDDELYALFRVIAVRGLRRGEACGLPWANTNLDHRSLDITTQIVQLGWETQTTAPKSEASRRIVALDTETSDILRAHQALQNERKKTLGNDWHDTGLVFTQADGRAWHPADISERFKKIIAQADLPPIPHPAP